MIVNIRIEVDDATRQRLASMAEGRPIKRQATRKEVTEFVEGALASLRVAPAVDGSETPTVGMDALSARRGGRKLSEPDPEDRETLADKPPSYIVGWNRYKYKCSQASSS